MVEKANHGGVTTIYLRPIYADAVDPFTHHALCLVRDGKDSYIARAGAYIKSQLSTAGLQYMSMTSISNRIFPPAEVLPFLAPDIPQVLFTGEVVGSAYILT